MRSGRAAEAIPHREQDIRLNPRSPHIYSHYELMGYALTFLGRYDEAISRFQRSLAAHPNMGVWLHSQILAAMAAAQALSGHSVEARVSANEARRLWPTLTVRSHHRAKFIGPVIAAQVARTPLVLDTGPWGDSIPTAVGLSGAGIGGTLSDEYQDRLGRKMPELPGGDRTRPIVAMGFNSERYQGRNVAVRLAALGYTEIHWYRGGREAWEFAGLLETELEMQDW